MKKIFYLIIGLSCAIWLPATATVIDIPDDYSTIQAGINASADGDTVLVQPGTYVENINFNGHNVVLGSYFLITGNRSFIHQTIIDGDSSGTVITLESGENNGAAIIGFTIQNGAARDGGGVLCDSSSPTLRNNIIRGNLAVFGGGICCKYSSAIITDNTIEVNKADRPRPDAYLGHGGGIYCWHSDPLIQNNDITGNWAFVNGAGIYCGSQANPLINNNTICDNRADINGGGGGGISVRDTSNAVVTNNIISGNYAYSVGGGIYIHRSDPVIENNVISSDSTYSRGGGIHCRDANPYIHYNVIEDNVAIGYIGRGGGVYCDDSNPEIVNNLIIRNISEGTSEARGGGIYCDDSNPEIVNNSIIGNVTDSDWRGGLGGGIYCESSNPVITNCTISGNTAVYGQFGGGGGGIYIVECSVIVTNTILWADSSENAPEIGIDMPSSLEITYCDIEGGWDGEGNLDLDPLFRNPAGDDFHLMSIECGNPYDSPCIDTGRPDIIDSLLDCSWGLGEIRSDMGAYGGGYLPWAGDCAYVAGDVNNNGTPLELGDVITMIANYRGSMSPAYICDCGFYPPGSEYAATADPNGNCVANELSDVVIEIGAYRGSAEVSGCPDCPGLRMLQRGDRIKRY